MFNIEQLIDIRLWGIMIPTYFYDKMPSDTILWQYYAGNNSPVRS